MMSRILAVSVVLVAPFAHAGQDGLALMQKSDARHHLDSERTNGSMVLQKEGGEARTRALRIFTAGEDSQGNRMMIRFDSPADIKNTAFLSIEDPRTKDTEQWLYLPAFRKTRRVGKAELGDRFVNSDFYFEDLQAREVEDYAYVILRSEAFGGQDCWVIESVPEATKVKKESPYGKSHLWLRKDNLFVTRIRHFDRRMRPLKELTLEQLKNVSGDVWRADKITVVDIKRKHRTVMLVAERLVGKKAPRGTFSQHNLASE
jgi:hypothetical protein